MILWLFKKQTDRQTDWHTFTPFVSSSSKFPISNASAAFTSPRGGRRGGVTCGRKERRKEEEKSRGREEGEKKEKKKEGRNHTTTVSAGTTPIYTKTWTLSCKCSHTKNLCVFQEPRQTLHATLAFLCRTSSQLVPLKNPNSFSSSELVRKWEYTQFSPILTSTYTYPHSQTPP